MKNNICNTCGGDLKRVGNVYICESCGNTWEMDETNDTTAIQLANAWEALRQSDFDKSAELFEEVIISNAKNHEAYWGKSLALNGIIFVTDLNENKKVPTCNNISENSFLDDKNVKTAISLAPTEISENYVKLSHKIEKIRIEWLEKASKEPPYDVFICFKDSDRENGIERTQDSIDAQDLYNILVDSGYKVFFSRVSLRDKVAEQFEPYIYNAIKTAKVMIVFGEKPEYFNAVWVKNEWNRYRARIEKGDKHKNSLVVVYKNMNANDLPVVLRSRQCLDWSSAASAITLTKHIKKVIEQLNQEVHLDKINIKGGEIGKKVAEIKVNAVQTREIGAGAIAETSLSEKQNVSLINTFLSAAQWDEATKLIEDVLFENPGCAEAVFCDILCKMRAKNISDLKNMLRSESSFKYSALLEQLLNCASKDFASEVLELFYENGCGSDAQYVDILKCILPYSFPRRERAIEVAFNNSIQQRYSSSFATLLGTLNENDVDKYIDYNLKFAKGFDGNATPKMKSIQRVLDVDEGNIEARRMKFETSMYYESLQVATADFENLLKYSKEADKVVEGYVRVIAISSKPEKLSALMKQIIRYYSGSLASFNKELCEFAFALLKCRAFKEAEYYFNLLLTTDKGNANVYWGICLMKIGATDDSDVINRDSLVKECPEYNKYLSLVSEKRRMEVIGLSNSQISTINKKHDDIFTTQKNSLLLQMESINERIKNVENNIIESESVLKKTKGSYFGGFILFCIGIWVILIGAALSITIILSEIGIPILIGGVKICAWCKEVQFHGATEKSNIKKELCQLKMQKFQLTEEYKEYEEKMYSLLKTKPRAVK